MPRTDILAFLSGAAPRPAKKTLLDEAVGFAAGMLFATIKPPALILGVVRDGERSIHGFGQLAGEGSEAPGAGALFRIGSITKPFAGQVLASLAAGGVVSLADPLTKYCPEFAAPMS